MDGQKWQVKKKVRLLSCRQVTMRNRRFLRKLTPFSPTIPVTQEEVTQSKVVTRSQTSPTIPVAQSQIMTRSRTSSTRGHSRGPADTDNYPATSVTPPILHNPTRFTVRRSPASKHRQHQAGKPGENIVEILKSNERRGPGVRSM